MSNFAYTYDAINRQTRYTGPEGTRGYTYDKTDQLTQVTSGGSVSESYSYDATGNRTNSGSLPGPCFGSIAMIPALRDKQTLPRKCPQVGLKHRL